MPLVEKIDGTVIRPCDVGRNVRSADGGSEKRGTKPGELPRRPEHPIVTLGELREPIIVSGMVTHNAMA
jgi:hypothetical protein